MKKGLIVFGIIILFLVGSVSAATYYVSPSNSTVNGDIFCNGPCTSSDIIIIQGGARGSLGISNLDGSGGDGVIDIINEDGVDQVVITSSGTNTALYLNNVKNIHLHGDNDDDFTYGIKVINDGSPSKAGTVHIAGESDHVEISYVEMAFDGNSGVEGNGIFVQDGSLDATWVYDTLEFHHNYIHGSKRHGMYIGHNHDSPGCPCDTPWIANVSIHHNYIVDSGGSGMEAAKGVHTSSTYVHIYNNTITNTGLIQSGGEFQAGITTGDREGGDTAGGLLIYNNVITTTKGPCIQFGYDNGYQVYDNICVNNGYGNDVADNKRNNGILFYWDHCTNCDVFDNIIVQPYNYGIYSSLGQEAQILGSTDKRNLICDAGQGERYDKSDGYLVTGTGADANVYEEDCADLNFKTWSDDGDYSNDDFTLITFYCGDGTCEGIENCGTTDIAPECYSDCGPCAVGNALANSTTMTSNSNNFAPGFTAQNLWDNCVRSSGSPECTAGTNTSDLIWVEFDFASSYDLTTAIIFGDASGSWISRNWSLYYKQNSGDSWTEAFSGANALLNDWIEQQLNVRARFVRVEIFGNSGYPATQLRELGIYGTVVSSSCSQADSSGNSVVEIGELLTYISNWKSGSVSIGELLTAIGEWKNGC